MESIKVSLRVRPLHKQEIVQKQDIIWKINEGRQLQVDKAQLAKIIKSNQILPNKLSSYEFHQCFDQQSTNYDIFQLFAQKIVLSSLQGFNGTIFLYGQTGSGKTFTMLGACHNTLFKDGNIQNFIKQILTERRFNDIGILIYSLMEMFKQINKDQENFYLLKCSYYEIYNENVHDLLSKTHNDYSQSLQININQKSQEFELRGITETAVTSLEQVIELIRKGEKNRHYAETILNHQSSRSHTIFKLQIQIFKEKTQTSTQESYLRSNLVFVDLAGSERISSQPKEEDFIRSFYGLDDDDSRYFNKDRVRESQMINKSLFYLTRIIAMKVKQQNNHIPYRNSTLTKLLKGALSGNCKTALILCINPTINHLDQSLQTIKFGENAKLIENKVDINLIEFKNQQKTIEGLKEIKDLRKKIQDMEEAYKKQQFELQQVQKQLQFTLKDKEELLNDMKKVHTEKTQSSEGQDLYMNQCANLFLQSQSTTNTTQSNLDQLNQIVQEHEGSLIVDCYRELLNQLQGQQMKNKLLEDECQRLHRKILKHDLMIDSFSQKSDKPSKLEQSQEKKKDKFPRQRKSHPDPSPEEPRPRIISENDLTPIRQQYHQLINKSQILSSSLQNLSDSVCQKQDTEFEKQIKSILQAWDNQRSYINYNYPDQVSDFLQTDDSDKGEKQEKVIDKSSGTVKSIEKNKHPISKFSEPTEKRKESREKPKMKQIAQIRPKIKERQLDQDTEMVEKKTVHKSKTPLKQHLNGTNSPNFIRKPKILSNQSSYTKMLPVAPRKVRSLSQDSKVQISPRPRPRTHTRALSTKRPFEFGGIETTSFAEKLLHLTSQIELKKTSQSIEVINTSYTKTKSINAIKQQALKVNNNFNSSNFLKNATQVSSYEVYKQQKKQHQFAPQHIVELMGTQLKNKFNIKDIIFETESEIADEYSRSSVYSKK